MAESEEELKSLLMKVKEESKKSWLKAQHSENEVHGIWSHHFMGNRWGNSGERMWQHPFQSRIPCSWPYPQNCLTGAQLLEVLPLEMLHNSLSLLQFSNPNCSPTGVLGGLWLEDLATEKLNM